MRSPFERGAPSISPGPAGLRAVPLAIRALLATAIAATFLPVLIGIVRDWIQDPNYHHGFVIPLISGYLIWTKRQALREARKAPSAAGLALMLLSTALFIGGTAGAEVFTQRIGALLMAASLILWLQGWGCLRIWGFPLAFLLLAIPLPYVLYYGLTAPMQALAARCAVWALKGIGVQAVGQGNMVHLPQGSLEVAEACSGIRSLYAFLAVGALIAHSTAVPPWGRWIIFLATVPFAILGNAIRVWASGVGVYLVGPQTTRGALHESFGVLVFILTLAIFVLFRKVVRRLWSDATLSRSASSGSPGSMPGSSGPTSPPPEDSPISSGSRWK